MIDNTEKLIPFLFMLCKKLRVTAIVRVERTSTHLEKLIKLQLKDDER